MNMRIALVLTLLLVASAFSGQAAAQGGAEQLAFTWCYVDYGYSEGALVCRIVAVNPAGPAWSPDGTKIAFAGTHPFASAGSGEVAVLNLANGALTDSSDRPT